MRLIIDLSFHEWNSVPITTTRCQTASAFPEAFPLAFPEAFPEGITKRIAAQGAEEEIGAIIKGSLPRPRQAH